MANLEESGSLRSVVNDAINFRSRENVYYYALYFSQKSKNSIFHTKIQYFSPKSIWKIQNYVISLN